MRIARTVGFVLLGLSLNHDGRAGSPADVWAGKVAACALSNDVPGFCKAYRALSWVGVGRLDEAFGDLVALVPAGAPADVLREIKTKYQLLRVPADAERLAGLGSVAAFDVVVLSPAVLAPAVVAAADVRAGVVRPESIGADVWERRWALAGEFVGAAGLRDVPGAGSAMAVRRDLLDRQIATAGWDADTERAWADYWRDFAAARERSRVLEAVDPRAGRNTDIARRRGL